MRKEISSFLYQNNIKGTTFAFLDLGYNFQFHFSFSFSFCFHYYYYYYFVFPHLSTMLAPSPAGFFGFPSPSNFLSPISASPLSLCCSLPLSTSDQLGISNLVSKNKINFPTPIWPPNAPRHHLHQPLRFSLSFFVSPSNPHAPAHSLPTEAKLRFPTSLPFQH